jgi:hypothetical protein
VTVGIDMEGTVGQVQGSYDCRSPLAWIHHGQCFMLYCLKSRSMAFDSSPIKRFSLRLAPNRPCVSLALSRNEILHIAEIEDCYIGDRSTEYGMPYGSYRVYLVPINLVGITCVRLASARPK